MLYYQKCVATRKTNAIFMKPKKNINCDRRYSNTNNTGGDNVILEELKSKREKAGLTQQAMANEIGISRSTLSLLESGKRKPSFDMMKKIAKVLKEAVEVK